MDARALRLDLAAFGLALGVLLVAAAGFVAERNGAAAVMCAICLAGLVAGRLAGVPGTLLLPVALGLVVILWMVWVDPPSTSRRTSALAHAGGGALAGWALAATLARRLDDALAAALLALVGVVVLTIAWEAAEYLGDRALETALVPNRRDSAEDILFGTAGGVAGIALAHFMVPRRAGG